MGDYYDASFEIQCPACRCTKYRNPQMKLMVNVCGHPLCDSCVKMYFIKESGQCSECGMVLKRSKFRVQVFEDPVVEKEIDIRRKVMKVYNMTEDDFSSLEEWNKYLEEIEEIVYNMTNDINRAEMEKKVENYERMHKNDIRKNYIKKSRDLEEIDRVLDAEMLRTLERQKLQKEEIEKSKLSRERTKTNLIKDLMASEGDASLIVQSHADRLKEEQQRENKKKKELELAMAQANLKSNEFSSGVKIGFAALGKAPILMKEELYQYEPPKLANSLPAPTWDELEAGGYLNHVRRASPQANAGGYTEHYACLRALQDFMSSHFLSGYSR
ncbi:CDK-activating kinase assembly factor MAT1 isoform X2 [Procambarus clarkii]|uniref:CDK-activating kinase assembly factor MAT1 isoform X2 n=1 Tax=Procambarus clarkii TaxID=6728 RepID=UPI001E676462|nr:CDK-activating kinase assembly factor MAT1-like isoform X2 [Procambarus clarkii]